MDAKAIEDLLRHHIKFVAELSTCDTRVLKLVGYKQAARDIVRIHAGETDLLGHEPRKAGRPRKTAP